LESALLKLLTNFQQTTGMRLNSQIDLPLPLPIELNTTIYRIVQESLTNICKHAEAKMVIIELKPEASRIIHLLVEDDGQGFNPTQNTTGFGIQGMRERALAVGGQFHLQSQSGKGCRISVSFPLSPSGL
jgi:signal transduction histidine kinase